MADPLSITASVIAVVGLAAKVAKTAHILRSTFDETAAIHQDIKDLEALFTLFDKLREESWGQQQLQYLSHADCMLQDIKTILLELQGRLTEVLPTSNAKPNRLQYLRHEKPIKKLQQQLRARKQSLLDIFTLASTSTTQAIDVRIEALQLLCEDTRSSNQKSQQHTLDKLENLEQLLRAHSIYRERLLGNKRAIEAVALHQVSRSASTQQPASNPSSTNLSCPPFCSCRCHKRQAIVTPAQLEGVLGRMFLGFSAESSKNTCDETMCKRNRRSNWRFQYTFPSWLLRYTVSALVSMSACGAPELVLRLPRVRPNATAVFEHVKTGSIEDVKEALQSCKASIHDVDEISEHSLLHMALAQKQPAMIDFLLGAGADINVVNKKRNSCGDIFWTIVLSRGLEESEYEPLISRFEESSYIEEGQFTILHKIVFGLVQSDLEQHLQASTKEINTSDAYGRTALAWAAARSDLDSVDILLRYGADPNVYEKGGWGPLHNSMLTDNEAVSLRLLQSGANPNAGSRVYNETPLYIACRPTGYKCHIPNLLKHGANPTLNLLHFYQTPLQCAVERNFPDAIRALLPATPAEHHTLAVVSALRLQSSAALDILVELGASCAGIDDSGRSIFHHIAMHASITSLKSLLALKLISHISVHLADGEGVCAADLAALRSVECGEWEEGQCGHHPHCVNQEWWEAWASLTGLERESQSHDVDQDEIDDVFVDALEVVVS